MFPPGFIDETLRTMALFLPQYNAETETWFERQGRKHPLDTNATNCDLLPIDQRQIGKFLYWHERLAIVKQAFDESEPKTICQWWEDRRKPVQWYNFWLAVALIAGLTIFFEPVQSIEGALQVYKAYRPS